jgi:DNA invertase Pin-like site-specific DNA recombinase
VKICLYIRLSSADKDLKFKDESESIANQRALLHQYLRSHQEFQPYEVLEFIDDGFSGTNGNRPGFERMIEFLKDGGAKLVLCKDLSRFFRDYVEIGDYLERVFPTLGVRLIAVNDGYDSDDYKGTTGGMEVVMKCIIYAFYSKDLSVKIRTVLDARVRKGQYIGAYAPYGYLKDPANKNHLVPDPVAAPVIRRIFALALEGKTTGEIARSLNNDHVETPAAHFHRLFPDCRKFLKNTSKASSWTCTNVHTILRRQEYTGAVVSKRKDYKCIDHANTIKRDESEWVIVPNCHEPIVSMETYEAAQNAILKKKTYERKGAAQYLLRSLVRCGVCGRIMTRHKKGTRTPSYYYCEKSRFTENTPCPTYERFYEADLERMVVQSLSQLLQTVVDSDKRVQEAAAKSKGSAEHIRRTLLRIDQTVKQNATAKMAAYESYADGKITRDEFLQRRDQLASDTERLTAEKATLAAQLTALEQAQDSELHTTAEAASEFLKAEDVTNEMLRQFIDRVNVFTGGRIEIVYRFSNPFMDSLAELQAEPVSNQ